MMAGWFWKRWRLRICKLRWLVSSKQTWLASAAQTHGHPWRMVTKRDFLQLYASRLGYLLIETFKFLILSIFSSNSHTMATPDIGKMNLSDSSDNEDLFASPSRPSKPSHKSTKQTDAPPQRNGESKYDTEQAREASLQRELESVRSINDVIEGVVNSLECAGKNMDVSTRRPRPLRRMY